MASNIVQLIDKLCSLVWGSDSNTTELLQATLALKVAADAVFPDAGASASEQRLVERKLLDLYATLERVDRQQFAWGSGAAMDRLLAAWSLLGQSSTLIVAFQLRDDVPRRLAQMVAQIVLGSGAQSLESAAAAARAAAAAGVGRRLGAGTAPARAPLLKKEALLAVTTQMDVLRGVISNLSLPQHTPAGRLLAELATKQPHRLTRWLQAALDVVCLDPHFNSNILGTPRPLGNPETIAWLLEVLTNATNYEPLRQQLEQAASGSLQQQLDQLLLKLSLPVAQARAMAALALPAGGQAQHGVGNSWPGARHDVAEAEKDARWLCSLVSILVNRPGRPLLRHHLSSGDGAGIEPLLLLVERLQQLPLGPGGCAVGQSTRLQLVADSTGMYAALTTELAATQPPVALHGAARQRVGMQALRLFPLAAATAARLLELAEQGKTGDLFPALQQAQHISALHAALESALDLMQGIPPPTLSVDTAVATVEAAEAALRLVPQLVRRQAAWLQDPATAQALASRRALAEAADDMADRAAKAWFAAVLAVQMACGSVPDPSGVSGRVVILPQPPAADQLALPLLQLHSAGCRYVHAAAVAGPEERRAAPYLQWWAGQYVGLTCAGAVIPCMLDLALRPDSPLPDLDRQLLARLYHAQMAAHMEALAVLEPRVDNRQPDLTPVHLAHQAGNFVANVARNAPAGFLSPPLMDRLAAHWEAAAAAAPSALVLSAALAMQLLGGSVVSERLAAGLAARGLLPGLLDHAGRCPGLDGRQNALFQIGALAAGLCRAAKAAAAGLKAADPVGCEATGSLATQLSSAARAAARAFRAAGTAGADLEAVLAAAVPLAQALQRFYDLPEQQVAARLELAKAVAVRSCAHLRCPNTDRGKEGQHGSSRKGRCSACQTVRYCGTACQHADWAAGHKRVCKALAALRQHPPEAGQQQAPQQGQQAG